MFSNKKGIEISFKFIIGGIIVVVVIIGFTFMYLMFSGGTKEGGDKLFGKIGDYKKLAEDFFSEEEKGLTINQRTDYVRDLVLSNFSIKGDNCLSILDIGDKEKIKGLSVYFMKNKEKGMDFYIFEGDNWRDDFGTAILNNKYIKKGFFSGDVHFIYSGNEINELLLHNNLEFITFTSDRPITEKITGFAETLDVSGIKGAELYNKITQNQIGTSNYKVVNPVFLKNGDKIQILDMVQLLTMYKSVPPCRGVVDIVGLVVNPK